MLSMVGWWKRGQDPAGGGLGWARGRARPGACQTRWSRTSPAAPSRPGPAPWWESLASWCFCPRCRLPAGALTDKSLTPPWGEAQEGVEGSWTQIAKGKVPRFLPAKPPGPEVQDLRRPWARLPLASTRSSEAGLCPLHADFQWTILSEVNQEPGQES